MRQREKQGIQGREFGRITKKKPMLLKWKMFLNLHQRKKQKDNPVMKR